jgi:hypothetical protein
MRGISRLDEKLLASQVGLCSMGLVSFSILYFKYKTVDKVEVKWHLIWTIMFVNQYVKCNTLCMLRVSLLSVV